MSESLLRSSGQAVSAAEMTPLERLAYQVNWVLERVCAALAAAMILIVWFGVFERYLMGMGQTWTEELARFLLIWSSFLSATIVVNRSGHFCIMFLVEMLPAAAHRAVALVLHLVTIGVLGVMFVQGVRVTSIMRIQVSPAMDLRMDWIYLSLPVSVALMIFFLAAQLPEMLHALKAGPQARETR